MSRNKKPSIWDMAIIGRNNVDALKQAVADGADVFELSENDYSLLHCAAENNAKDNVVFLLEQGLDPTRTSLGKTPAQKARDQGNTEVAELIEEFAREKWVPFEPRCPDCQVTLEPGFVPDLAYESRYHHETCRTFWLPGEPRGREWKAMVTGNTDLDDLGAMPIVVYRCPDCGLLRPYARKQ